jgi:hypothetical protein
MDLHTTTGALAGEILTATGAAGADWARPPTEIAVSIIGKPDAGEMVLVLPMCRKTVFPDNLAGSRGVSLTKATGSSVFSVKRNGVQFATCTFTSSDSLGAFTTAGSTPETLAVGSVLTITGPASQDATLASVGLNLKGTRGE